MTNLIKFTDSHKAAETIRNLLTAKYSDKITFTNVTDSINRYDKKSSYFDISLNINDVGFSSSFRVSDHANSPFSINYQFISYYIVDEYDFSEIVSRLEKNLQLIKAEKKVERLEVAEIARKDKIFLKGQNKIIEIIKNRLFSSNKFDEIKNLENDFEKVNGTVRKKLKKSMRLLINEVIKGIDKKYNILISISNSTGKLSITN